ncbi:MAG: ABC transporter permease [Desulfatiglans sp.]|jgi:microcin C transport system permease protein|nr:ABC transporter permease [Desulfatiglans sp.]
MSYNFLRLKSSDVNRRRLKKFKANKRGYYSLLIFLFLLIFTLPAEFISNDKPLIVRYKKQIYFPVFVDYPESVFGGFLAKTNYRDPFIIEEIISNGWMIWPPFKYGYRTINKIPGMPVPSPPSIENPLGTDNQARDVFARLIYGFRTTIIFSLILTIFSSIIGIITGAVQGYLGGLVDLIFQRLLEIWNGLPLFFLLIVIFSIINPGFWILICVLLVFSWAGLSNVVRAEVLRIRNFDFIKSARALGVKRYNILLKHVLPNAMVAAMTFIPFTFSGAVTMLIILDFLGFGLPAGSASLGELLSQGRANIQAPWLGIVGFFSVSITLVLIIFIGEAFRDAFDPKKI